MDRIAPKAPPPELQVRAPQLDADKGPAAQAAEPRFAEHLAALSGKAAATEFSVQLDADAQRFVAIWTDPDTDETLRSYPSESQLAYSRAVMAYLRALNGDK